MAGGKLVWRYRNQFSEQIHSQMAIALCDKRSWPACIYKHGHGLPESTTGLAHGLLEGTMTPASSIFKTSSLCVWVSSGDNL